MVSRTVTRRTSKPITFALVIAQIAIGFPAASVSPAAFTGQEPSRTIKINQTVPTVTAAPLAPKFSADPTDAELFRARIFTEPLIPMDGSAVPNENRALANALRAYLNAGGRDSVGPLKGFLAGHPSSRWRASLLTNLGLVYRRTGHLLRALAAWEEAWALSRSATEPLQRAVADRAIGELFELNASLGRFETLEELFEVISGRDIRGSATEKVSGARQALWLMHNRPEESFRCGPLAIDQILRYGRSEHIIPSAVEALKSTQQGTSLAQLSRLAGTVGLQMRMALRETGAHVHVPSVLHWKAGHFAAIVESKDDEYLVRDPTFGGEMWVRQSTLDEEASGYFLIPTGDLLPGWRAVVEDEGATVWGKGVLAGIDPTDDDNDPTCPNCAGGPGPNFGMPVPSIHMLLISIRLNDIPVGYRPAVGPSVLFDVTYNQRDSNQPQIFSYSNLGSKWSFDWLSFIEDDPANPAAAVTVFHRKGGRETSTSFNASTQSYTPTTRKQAVIVRTSSSPITYERRLPDGSVEVFSQPDGALSFPRKVFMTAIKDPSGNALTFTWDSNLRIVAATDALGQVTTISYENSDPLKITRVTDPFGRFATFEYDSAGRLYRITDVLGLSSSVTYGASDILKTMTTPYGTTSFTAGETGLVRWAEMTDPLGGKERVHYGGYVTSSEPLNQVPTGLLTNHTNINHHNTLHWNSRAMAVAPGDPASATDYNWALMQSGAYQAVAVPLSVKRPLEGRVWYNYQGGGSNREGTVRKPVAIGRVLDDGTSQVTKYEYNSRGHVTKQIDPLGRETIYEYDVTGLDLLRTKQKNGPGYQLLEERTYNGQGLPLTVTDAAGQTTTYTYDAQGQVLTVTNAKSETTTYSYTNDLLTGITGPVSGATTTFTYDAYGRVRTSTESDGYTITTDYDLFDRPIRTTYPDATYEETTYRYLDAQLRRDRLGRITHYTYDATRRLTAVQDPLGRIVTQEWCSCGSLDALVDAKGNRTHWERDVQGRVTKEIRANAADSDYVYETRTSRLKTVTDPKQQVTTYTYALDDQLTGMAFTNGQIATPSVSFTYDPVFGRLATMVDGTGTTTYSYHAITTTPTPGATQLASVDGPLTNDTITYTYDQLGRVTTRAIDGIAVDWAFDALGRVTTETNALGTFAYTYNGPTGRIATVTYPNGQTSVYAYFGNAGDRRLQTIHHRYPNMDTLSRFDYAYDAVGNILTWRQEADPTAAQWEYGYDRADQLITALKKSTEPTPAVLKRYAYGYDPAGSRIVEQIDDAVVGATHNNVNELVAQSSSGLLRFEGTVSEAATVTVGGKAAVVTADNQFSASVPVMAGANTVTITAVDGSGNSTTDAYQVTSAGTSKTFSYDANGNLTSDGTRTFEWDARDQPVAITVGTHRSEFTYDGFRRLVRLVEKESDVIQSDVRRIWCQTQTCEERGADGVTVLRREFGSGEEVAGAPRYFAADHQESIRAVTDSLAATVAQYTFDPWGRRTKVSGGGDTLIGFTGHEVHGPSSSYLSMYRLYDSELGRWASEDPAGLRQGTNLYAYVGNNTPNWIDPFGLAACSPQQVQTCVDGCRKRGKTFSSCTLITIPCVLSFSWCQCKGDGCAPCPPRGPDFHQAPPSRKHYPCPGDHTHYYVPHQGPPPACKCNYRETVVCAP